MKVKSDIYFDTDEVQHWEMVYPLLEGDVVGTIQLKQSAVRAMVSQVLGEVAGPGMYLLRVDEKPVLTKDGGLDTQMQLRAMFVPVRRLEGEERDDG